MRTLVVGAGIAGPSAAYWLARTGADVTVVERAPGVRPGGHGVDVRGAQLEVLRRMDLVGAVHERRTRVTGHRIVDAAGRTRLRLPVSLFGGDLEIGRGDLADLLHERTRDDVRHVFGDRVVALAQDVGGVDVTFASGGEERYDLVVGADGQHSGIRALVLGPEERFREGGDYVHAGCAVPNDLGLDGEVVMYNEPGIGVSLTTGRDPARLGAGIVVHAPGGITVADLARRTAAAGWEAPRIAAALPGAADLYVDALAQLRLPRYAEGRVVLLGDAAWGAGPGGGGTGLAMTGAYVLVAALRAAGDAHAAAFARYEAAVRPAAAAGLKQARDAGRRFLAPPTASALRGRDLTLRVLSSRPVRPLFDRLTSAAADTLRLDGWSMGWSGPDPETRTGPATRPGER